MKHLSLDELQRWGSRIVASLQHVALADHPEILQAIARSELIVQQQFSFAKPWDMEPCHTRFAYDVRAQGWNTTPNGDEEWCFMLNRMDYLEDLVLAGACTGTLQYFETAFELIEAWIAAHPTMRQELSTRTLDTGIRIFHTASILPLLASSKLLSHDALARIIESLYLQMTYLKQEYLPRYETSNWGSIQTGAMLCCYLMLGDRGKEASNQKQCNQKQSNQKQCNQKHIDADEMLDSAAFPASHAYDELFSWAYTTFLRQISIQVYPDGNHWELSPMYHVEVLHMLLCVLGLLELRGFSQPKELVHAAHNMTYALFQQLDPHGCIEALGDSDVTSVRDILAFACAVLHTSGDVSCISQAVPLDQSDLSRFEFLRLPALCDQFEEASQQGASQQSTSLQGKPYTQDRANKQDQKNKQGQASKQDQANKRSEPCLPPHLPNRSFDAEDAGLFVVRSSWSEHAHMMLLLNGPLGSGHGHADNQHISLWYDGAPIFSDSGRYTYREDLPERCTLKAAPAHNSILVDHKSASVPSASWSFSNFSYPLKNYTRHLDHIHYFETARFEQDAAALLLRRVIFFEEGIWFISDEIKAAGTHTLESLWHTHPHVHVAQQHPLPNERPFSQICTLYASDGTSCKESEGSASCGFSKQPTELRIYSTAETAKLSSAISSRCYNQLEEHSVLSFESTTHDFGSILSIFASPDVQIECAELLQGGVAPVAPSQAHAYRITTNSKSYSVAIFHHEVFSGSKMFTLDGQSFHAKVAVLEKSLYSDANAEGSSRSCEAAYEAPSEAAYEAPFEAPSETSSETPSETPSARLHILRT